jgi:hypothetical protein
MSLRNLDIVRGSSPRRRVVARGEYRIEAARLALPSGGSRDLDQVEEPGSAGGQAGGGRGLGGDTG